jgi:uncharacterized membrane protein YjjB (DUF3815 family)
MDKTAILQIVTGCLGSLGFAVLFNISGKKLVFASLGGLLSWTFFLLLGFLIEGEAVRYFLSSFALSIYAEVMARRLKTPTTTFIIISLVPLIPGSSLYYTMASAVQLNIKAFLERGIHTLSLAGALALGIIVSSTIIGAIRKLPRKG